MLQLSGKANARGSTTSEFRVPELKITALPEPMSKRKHFTIKREMKGIMNINAIYIGTTLIIRSQYSDSLLICEDTTVNRVRAINGTGIHAEAFNNS